MTHPLNQEDIYSSESSDLNTHAHAHSKEKQSSGHFSKA